MRKTVLAAGVMALSMGILSLSPPVQSNTIIPFGPSIGEQGILFTGGNPDGSLSVQIGGCPPGTPSFDCISAVSGSVASGATLGAYSLTGSYAIALDSLTATSTGDDTWSLAGGSDQFNVSIQLFEYGLEYFTLMEGSIEWTGLTEEEGSEIFLSGTLNYTDDGVLSSIIGTSGSAPFSIELASLVCGDIPADLPCELGTIAGTLADPPTGFAGIASAGVGNVATGTSATPEPDTLLLLGSGLLGLAPPLRRKFAWS